MNQTPIRTVLFGLINTYLVLEKDGLTLIDTGMPSLAPRILKKVTQLGQPIKRIVLTHGHDDHSLGLDLIKEQFPQAQVMMHAADEPNLTRLNLKTRPDTHLRGGEQIGSLKVIATPGHSEGHLAYLDKRDGTLYAGDSFVNVPGLRVVTELHPLFPMPTLGTWNADEARASARQLTQLDGVQWLALGHGKPIPQPLDAMSQAVLRAEKQNPPTTVQLKLAHSISGLMGGAKGHL